DEHEYRRLARRPFNGLSAGLPGRLSDRERPERSILGPVQPGSMDAAGVSNRIPEWGKRCAQQQADEHEYRRLARRPFNGLSAGLPGRLSDRERPERSILGPVQPGSMDAAGVSNRIPDWGKRCAQQQADEHEYRRLARRPANALSAGVARK